MRSVRTLPLISVLSERFDRHFVAYVGIGVLTQALDIGVFALLVRAGTLVVIASAAGIGVATGTHFLLNKYANFRNHERGLGHQARTYAAVGAASIGMQLLAIGFLSRSALLSPVVAKLVVNVASFPINYLLHRYLTFGRGIRGAIASWRARSVRGEEAVMETPA